MNTSPMMQQYHRAKEACGDALLLFRMGDFYELFYRDAEIAAEALGLTLTSRDKGENPIPMAGFPYHQLEGYLARLIAAGFRAAVCEQVEDPKKAKGLVQREITRVVTPGTLTDDSLLDPVESNFLAALIAPAEGGSPAAAAFCGLAWCDLSTGRFSAAQVPRNRIEDHLGRVAPAECLREESSQWPELQHLKTLWTERPSWTFSANHAHKTLTRHLGTTGLEGFGFSPEDELAVRAAGAVLEYLAETQKASLAHIRSLVPYRNGEVVEIDVATRRSLELTRTLRDGQRRGSLLAVMDRTVTAMGARLLSDWLANPLTSRESIEQRLDSVHELIQTPARRRDLRDALRQIYDLQRLLARVTTLRATPRDLGSVAKTLNHLPAIEQLLAGCQSPLLDSVRTEIRLCPELRDELDAALADDCPLQTREGGIIREGYHQELDQLRQLAAGGKQWIAEYQAREAERVGVPNLKVRFNKVFGYYIELTNAHRDKAPENYIRKQTLKNAERYITPELKEYEDKVLSSDERAKELEYELFTQLRERVQEHSVPLQSTAELLAQLDVLQSLAELAAQRGYCRPTLSDAACLRILDGKHPVLDVLEPDGEFVPNDTELGDEAGNIMLITGPNMAGKSTYIRQVALLTVMAQMGSFVPAREAQIGVADRVFARVGASDELARGQSTFMVEMTETARILNTATARSLVILDEIGRGTSTYDGISLAWAIVEHLHDQIGCRTLFATHYHELTDLQRSLPRVRNFNVAVKEWDENVVFLHKITPGTADKSYGIHVARLAGVPGQVNERAKEVLAQLENDHLDPQGQPKVMSDRSKGREIQLTLFAPQEHPLLDELRKLDLNGTTPLEALTLLNLWQQRLANTP